MPRFFASATYDDAAERLSSRSDQELEKIIKAWDTRPLLQKALAFFNIIDDSELEYSAAMNLLETRRNPESGAADK